MNNLSSPLVHPKEGSTISYHTDGTINVPNHPIIPFIEGDGTGVDITPVMKKVVDYAVQKAYNNTRSIAWMELYVGKKAIEKYGQGQWLPDEALEMMQQYKVAIKGPLTTPVGQGMRSLNVSIRQKLDLYVCLRPVRYFSGTPSPLKEPEKTDMVIFRENSEDIYAGIEWAAETPENQKLMTFLQNELNVQSIRFPASSGLGLKPISKEGTERLVKSAIDYALQNKKSSVTLVHKGNIMKFTEGAFAQWGYELAKEQYHAKPIDGGPWLELEKDGHKVVIKDVIADAFLQQILLRPTDYDVIATMNLNGDYISDALAAQVGGIGIAPGANLGEQLAVFEATHGTAPKYAGQNKVNPGSLILSAEMMLRHLQWTEAADLIIKGMEHAILNKTVTYDFHRLMDDATLLTCSEFGDAMIAGMG